MLSLRHADVCYSHADGFRGCRELCYPSDTLMCATAMRMGLEGAGEFTMRNLRREGAKVIGCQGADYASIIILFPSSGNSRDKDHHHVIVQLDYLLNRRYYGL